MRSIFIITIILFLSTACAAQPAAPTPSPTSTPSATQISSPTPTPTATPTESPLPAGPISELQTKLGDKYKLTPEGDYFVIKGIDNLKFSPDGTAQLVYDSEDLTVAFQAISAENEALQIGPWQNKDGIWTMLTAGAPKTVEDAAKFPKLAYLEGVSPEKQKAIDLTIHKYVQMATAKSDTYDPADEYNERYVNGKKEESKVPTRYKSYIEALNGGPTTYIDKPSNEFPALGQGYANLAVFDASGQQILDANIIPILIRDTDGTIFSMVGLIDQDNFVTMLELGLLTKEKRAFLTPFLPATASDIDLDPIVYRSTLANIDVQKFASDNDQELLAKGVIKPSMDKLPQDELKTMGFWNFAINDSSAFE